MNKAITTLSSYRIGILLIFSFASNNAFTAQFSVIDIGRPSGSNYAFALDINNLGQVSGTTGAYFASNVRHGFIWDSGVFTEYGAPAGYTSVGITNLNESGIAVGYGSPSGSGLNHAVVWNNGIMSDIGTLPGNDRSNSEAVSDAGQVVGWSQGGGLSPRSFLWENGAMSDLGAMAGTNSTWALGINENVQIVGYGQNGGGSPQAFFWDSGAYQYLGDLPGGDVWSIGHSLNDYGQVVGRSFATGGLRAFIWEDGVMTDLGVLSGHLNSSAVDINNLGQVLGYSYSAADASDIEYFLWTEGDGMQNLSSMNLLPAGCTFDSVGGINDSGQIVVSGECSDAQYHSFVLTPTVVPLPPSILLFFSGISGLMIFAKRNGKY